MVNRNTQRRRALQWNFCNRLMLVINQMVLLQRSPVLFGKRAGNYGFSESIFPGRCYCFFFQVSRWISVCNMRNKSKIDSVEQVACQEIFHLDECVTKINSVSHKVSMQSFVIRVCEAIDGRNEMKFSFWFFFFLVL